VGENKSSIDSENLNDYNNVETLLFNQDSRIRLTSEISELTEFLKMRLKEHSTKDNTLFSTYMVVDQAVSKLDIK